MKPAQSGFFIDSHSLRLSSHICYDGNSTLEAIMIESSIDIAHIIQLCVAPVFLLAGIGAILNVLAGRLARIVDRVRELRQQVDKDQFDWKEIELLQKRAKTINLSLSFCTFAATLVCILIITLFTFHFSNIKADVVIAGLFISTMCSLAIGLALFELEVYYAIKWLRVSHSH